MSIPRVATATTAAIVISLIAAPQAQASESPGIKINENRSRVTAVGDGFVVKLSKRGLDVKIDDDQFGDPSTGNPIVRQTIDLTGRTLTPFQCENGTYTIRTGTFDRTFRISKTDRRPPPYTPGFATAFPGILTPFVGAITGTVTNADGETLRFLVSDLAHEELTSKGFTSIAPIHGLFIDASGRIRDRISLVGRFRSGPAGEHAKFGITDRGTCRQRANLPFGPGSENALVTGPFFVLPFNAPVKAPKPPHEN